MSDFLTTLAARTLGAIPVVTPRRRSRFEPDTNEPAPTLHDVALQKAAPTSPAIAAPSARPHPDHVASAPSSTRTHSIALPHAPAPNAPITPPATTAPVLARAQPIDAKTTPAHSRPSSQNDARETPVTQRLVASSTAQLTQRLVDRAAASALRRDSSSAPSIHVSIGRVEVRAIQRADKPPPPTPAAPAPPRSSLGSYLRGSRAPRE